jgi:cysteine sulfinate desulfinase/cysteine desulfurase-like protein
MQVNNEIGTVQPLPLWPRVPMRRALFLCDAVQGRARWPRLTGRI